VQQSLGTSAFLLAYVFVKVYGVRGKGLGYVGERKYQIPGTERGGGHIYPNAL
jgi:hypothetical protein